MSTLDQSKTGIIEIRKRDKTFYVRSGNADGFWREVSNNQWEDYTFDIFDKFIDSEHSYIDIGAWIGPTILYGCQIAKKAYGIEPDPIAYSELLANLQLNQPFTENVNLFDICIAPESGKILFGNRGDGGDSMSSILFDNGKTTWKVQGRTFDSFIKENGISDCNFIKMDIEGGEYFVVPTMKRYLIKHRPTLYLSLHPGFLGSRGKLSIKNRTILVAMRFVNTLRIVKALVFYEHFYDVQGNEISPFSVLIKCMRSTFLPIVFTDINWGTPKNNLSPKQSGKENWPGNSM
jgi:FkbM family methyltransferase